ncbi:D-inositol-3-phosphate glycosyltransferase [Moorella thermoacetica]|uniref:glycosyltransferase family 4 protein n=1 Tax=Neomoorella thermoacetica TaxID=1525 RepID=UPI0030CCDAE4
MRIGIDARYGLRKNRRGIGNYIYHLLCEFRRMRPPRCEFILYADDTADPEVVAEFQQDSFTIRVLSALNLAWWEQVALPLAVRRDGVDLLHCTSNIAPVLFKPCRLITTIHDVIEFRRQEFGDTKLAFRHRLSRTYRMGVLPRVAKLSDRIVTVSEYSRQDIAAVLKVKEEKIVVVYEAPTLQPSSDPLKDGELLKRLGIEGDYVFAFGALDRRKNTAGLIDAYKILRNQMGISIPLVIAGIERPEVFQPLASKGIYLLGFQPDEVISALYRHAIFFVYPSLYEGFGLPVLEAMASGTPVLCSATTAVGEITGEAALKCDPADISDIAAKMRTLLEDAILRKQLVERGYRQVEEFSWRRCAQESLQIYREVLGG